MKRAVAMLAFSACLPLVAGTPPAAERLPQRLRDTGFHDACKTAFTPSYPLWSDGASKKRWICLPPGTSIDKSNPDAWEFPVGTRFWKEFGFQRPVETRYIERMADGSWRFLTYAWNEEGTEARLAAEDGEVVRGRTPVLSLGVRPRFSIPSPPASLEGKGWQIPSRSDCLACHEGPAVPVLGYSAVQLASPATVAADGETERKALGYLHGNCGHCHNDNALSGVELVLAQRASEPDRSRERVLASLIGHGSRFRAHGAKDARRIVPGSPRESVVLQRMKSRNPMARMPPLGVQVADEAGLALIERWIHSLDPHQEKRP